MEGNRKDNFRFSFFHFPGWTPPFGELRKYLTQLRPCMAQDVADRANSRVNKLQNTIHITGSYNL